MKLLLNLFLFYLFFVYLIRPFFEGLFGRFEAMQGNNPRNNDRNNDHKTRKKAENNYTDYEEIK